MQQLKNYLKNKGRLTGFASYSMVLLIALISILIVSLIQSRLLLSIYRRQSLSDTLVNEYAAESEIYDIFTRVVTYGATFPPDDVLTLPDGTQLTIDTEEDPITGDQAVTVTARRPYAVTILRGDRTVTVTGTDRVEIILAIDCTGSMDNPSGTVDGFGKPTTRIEEAENAALAFVDAIIAHPNYDRFYIGVEVFGIDAAWLKVDPLDVTSADLTPTNNHAQVRTSIAASFGHDTSFIESPACSLVIDNTSIGSSFALARDYFMAYPVPLGLTVKRAEVLITDGAPNSRMPYADCPDTDFGGDNFCPAFRHFCPGKFYENTKIPQWQCDNAYMSSCLAKREDDVTTPLIVNCNECQGRSRDFVRCVLAKSGTTYTEPPPSSLVYSGGVRDPDVDAYVVTIYNGVSPEIRGIFETYATKYFDLGNAANLTTILGDIFDDIVTSTSSFTLRRIIPAP
ncbi:TPA: hypothetical protein DIV55_04100 [Patescibacteria group bacterium]|nr:hypothetical protein [Patescibacteria group bacterium]